MNKIAIHGRSSRFQFSTGDRVINDQGESGTLGRETFHGPWKGYQLGWWVRYDRDYTTRTLVNKLTHFTAPIQEGLFETAKNKQETTDMSSILTKFMESDKGGQHESRQ